ncbi:hypothetical protein LSAT2_003315 [Lamellibrachia satsuma]|nr:hypothetical protein LSAT2_003315 [Lamellibrachia satsuma]
MTTTTKSEAVVSRGCVDSVAAGASTPVSSVTTLTDYKLFFSLFDAGAEASPLQNREEKRWIEGKAWDCGGRDFPRVRLSSGSDPSEEVLWVCRPYSNSLSAIAGTPGNAPASLSPSP